MVREKIILLFLLIPLFFTKAQTLFLEENFDYTSNDLLTDHGWVAHSGGGTESITVNNGGLTYSGYPSSGIGNAALLDNNGEDVNISLTTGVNSGNIYISFLIDVTSSHTTITDGYILHLYNGSSHYARFFVDYDNASENIAFGLGQSTSTADLKTSYIYSRDVTYLAVIKYSFIVGDLNDEVRLWIISSGVPSNESNAGSPTLGPTTTTSEGNSLADPTSIDRIALRQYNSNQNIIVDGIRVADDWSLTPLPVELSSFSASAFENGIKLDWKTETEVNNYGFEIEHSLTSLETMWKTIGFIEGNGNSNSPNEYSFIDKDISGGKYYYRLKQIDNDGTFTYSKIIDFDTGKPLSYELDQNYPNPFNPVTTIKFTIPEANKVTVNVFNVLGEEIAEIVNQWMEAGTHEVNFDATDLNSGIYLYRIKAGNFVTTKKMTLLK